MWSLEIIDHKGGIAGYVLCGDVMVAKRIAKKQLAKNGYRVKGSELSFEDLQDGDIGLSIHGTRVGYICKKKVYHHALGNGG